MAMMRTRKDGGCSLCNASDANVGKKRCCHVLDNAAIAVRKEKGMNYIDISGKVEGNNTEFSLKANQEKIKSFMVSLSEGLSKKDQEGILSILREG